MDINHEELARLRAIAEEGRRAPLLGGRHLILWGAAMTAALLIQWAVLARVLPWPNDRLAISWFGLVVLAWIGSLLLGRRQAARGCAVTVGNRIERRVWVLAGTFLSIVALGLFARAMAVGTDRAWDWFAVMPPVGFGAYAIAIGASAAAIDDRGARGFAWLSLAFTAATTLLIGRIEQYPVAAAGIVLVAIGCGLHQLRAERRSGASG